MKSLDEKVDAIQESVHGINVTLAKQHVSLVEHMKRSDMLEKLVFLVMAGLAGLAVVVMTR